MASSRIMSRVCSRLPPLSPKFTTNKKASTFLSPAISPIKPISPARRLSRLPVELSCLETMMPLHNAIASARLKSRLSIESNGWCLVPQGISMPL